MVNKTHWQHQNCQFHTPMNFCEQKIKFSSNIWIFITLYSFSILMFAMYFQFNHHTINMYPVNLLLIQWLTVTKHVLNTNFQNTNWTVSQTELQYSNNKKKIIKKLSQTYNASHNTGSIELQNCFVYTI